MSVALFTNISSHSVDCLLVLFMVSFTVQKLLSLIRSHFKHFYLHCSRRWIREGNGNPLQYSCLEKSHGPRSRVGCSPWVREESDTTERLHFHFSLSCFGEGDGKQLQCSCLENPRDGGAWRVAVYGVAQSQTRLK